MKTELSDAVFSREGHLTRCFSLGSLTLSAVRFDNFSPRKKEEK